MVVSALILFIATLFLIIMTFVAVKVYAKHSLAASLLNFRNPLSHRPHPRKRPRQLLAQNEFIVAVSDASEEEELIEEVEEATSMAPMNDFEEHGSVSPDTSIHSFHNDESEDENA